MKHHRELLRILPSGYTIGYPSIAGNPDQREGRRLRGVHAGHPFVLDPAGNPVVLPGGLPFRVCSSPSKASLRDDMRRCRQLAKEIAAQ